MNLEEVLDEVASRVPYLRAATVAPAEEGWIPCADLCRPGPALVALIASTGPGRGSHDLQVAASLFVQGYAFRVGGVALAAYALGLPVPAVAPAATAIRVDRHRPAALAVLEGDLSRPDPDELAARLFRDHMAPHVAAVREGIVVGERLLWGNVAASTAVAFRAVESAGGGQAVRRKAEALFAAAQPWLAGRGRFTTLRASDREGWYWDRASCCLWYRASRGDLCDDCSLIPAAELAERRRAQLAEVRT